MQAWCEQKVVDNYALYLSKRCCVGAGGHVPVHTSSRNYTKAHSNQQNERNKIRTFIKKFEISELGVSAGHLRLAQCAT